MAGNLGAQSGERVLCLTRGGGGKMPELKFNTRSMLPGGQGTRPESWGRAVGRWAVRGRAVAPRAS